MPRYNITGDVNGRTYVTLVKADSAKEARRIVEEDYVDDWDIDMIEEVP